MLKLSELTEQYQEVWNLVEDETLDLAMLEDTLSGIEGAIEVKSVNIVQFIRSLDADAEIIKAEEKRLADRRRALENKRDGIKKYLQYQMELAGLDKIKTPTLTLALQNNPPSVRIISEEGIPEKYLIPQAPTIDKKGILAALKAGEEVVGCELQQGRSLRIR
jgi:hypothetical protein